jgi:hypothetical protein
VKDSSVMDGMRKVQKNHGGALATARKLKEHILEEFAEEKQIKKFISIFKELIQDLEPQVLDWLNENNKIIEL